MEEFLLTDTALYLAGAAAALAATVFVTIIGKIVVKIQDSPNKLDDEFLPLLEELEAAAKNHKKRK